MLELGDQCILLEMESTSKAEALQELAAAVHAACAGVNQHTLVQVLQEREQVGSTGVGNGVAIPHAKVPGLEEMILCFGRSTRGISFDAVDNHPVHLFVQILSPMGMANEYLQTLARISRILKEEQNRRLLMQATSKKEILALFNSGPD
jgi:PTS system nitrogen regulatory IIA component